MIPRKKSIFEADNECLPLAARLRPQTLKDFVGQTHLLAPGRPLRKAIESGRLHSMIFWGPPGTGKTTLAQLMTNHARLHFVSLSAVLDGVREIRAAVETARQARLSENTGTLLFVDEVHRFNKSQQDAFLPHIENGTILFVGATTENPSFELNNALLSRARVYLLKALTETDIHTVINRALGDETNGLGHLSIQMDDRLRTRLAVLADGDARQALNLLEVMADMAEEQNGQHIISEHTFQAVISGGNVRRFDKSGEAFYDQISALHKAVRGSDPDASLYWLCRMLDGGCDPMYIARRVVRIASEDIGNADPRALHLALDAWQVQERLGSPEGELAIAQAIVYMACAAKSNAVYMAFKAATTEAQTHGSLDVPLHLRNAPTRLMKALDYGKTYRYAHNEPYAYAAGENYFPDGITPQTYYYPADRGLEIKIAEKLAWLRTLDEESKKK